nr:MAG: RNA dependent RNA polymerase [Leviviridae sp.]
MRPKKKAGKTARHRMMSVCVHSVCRMYVLDRAWSLLDEHVSLILGRIRARDNDFLVNVRSMLRFEYQSAESNKTLFQIQAFFSKRRDGADDKECTAAAVKRFWEGEELCRKTNLRLRELFMQEKHEQLDIYRQVDTMRRVIKRVLGDLDLPLVLSQGRVTSGASSTRSRQRALPHFKCNELVYTTSKARPLVEAFVAQFFPELRLRVVDKNANRIAFVPKSIKTHRTIAAENESNLFFQLAIDAYLKKRLRQACNIDLLDQSHNQERAREGSITGEWATVDLSMASDTLSLELVPYLFPEDWTSLLEALRSPFFQGPFGSGVYQKFSSMGNGFTFPVETLVFYAACIAVGSRAPLVYGDDIVIESELVPELEVLLRTLGFTFNAEKSFSSGPFRESCGADFWHGHNVRPIFFKSWSNLNTMQLCQLVNDIVNIVDTPGHLWDYAASLVRGHRLPLVPVGASTTSGVLVVAGLMDQRILHTHGGITTYKCLSSYERTRIAYGRRNYMLWHFMKLTSEEDFIATLVATLRPRIRMGKARWSHPSERPPTRCYSWSVFINNYVKNNL